MNMREWLAQADKDERNQLASDASTSVAYLWQIAGGHCNVSAELARRLHDATDGAVSVYELRPDLFCGLPPETPPLAADDGTNVARSPERITANRTGIPKGADA